MAKAKTKIVTIDYWDGSKQDVKVPVAAKYLEILPATGSIYWHDKKPVMPRDQSPPYLYLGGNDLHTQCLPGNRPADDGLDGSVLLKIEEV